MVKKHTKIAWVVLRRQADPKHVLREAGAVTIQQLLHLYQPFCIWASVCLNLAGL